MGGPSAPELRWLRVASYFRRDIDPCNPPRVQSMRDFFSSLPSIRLPLHSLKFGLSCGTLLESEVETAFTGTVVALCRGAEKGDSAVAVSGSHGTVSVVGKLAADDVRFIALAFVHSFDFVKGNLLVYTNSSEHTFDTNITVVRGKIEWEPHTAKGTRVPKEASSFLQPYVGSWVLQGIATGARVRSQRTNVAQTRDNKRRRKSTA